MENPSPSASPAISILVVGYNSADLIAKCLGSIPAACQQHSYEVLFVDQGDGSTERVVEASFPSVSILESRGNLGFAGGNNLLASQADGAFLLLLNPDVELLPGSIDALMDGVSRHPDASAWGGVTLDRDGKPDVGNTVHVPSLSVMASRIVGRSSAGIGADETFANDESAESLSGGFVLIERGAWDAANGLDERYFLYCEEVDLFYRLAQRGHSFWRIADARAFHDIGHGETHSPTRNLYGAAGVMQFARLHWGRGRQISAALLIWLGALVRYLAGSILRFGSARFRRLADANRALVLRPGAWCFGYDERKGLLVKLGVRQPR